MSALLTYAIVGIALVLVVEGIAYAVFTDYVKRALDKLHAVPERHLRSGGVLALVVGIGILWVVRL